MFALQAIYKAEVEMWRRVVCFRLHYQAFTFVQLSFALQYLSWYADKAITSRRLECGMSEPVGHSLLWCGCREFVMEHLMESFVLTVRSGSVVRMLR